MDTQEDVYYTENAEIIGGDGNWAMQQPVVVDNANLNWQEEGPEITVSYSESGNADDTLTENEVYLSTNAEDSTDNDKTQYFSILESTYQSEEEEYVSNVTADIIVNVNNQNESILPDMEVDVEDYAAQEDDNKDDTMNSQVVLFNSDDPDEMYAIQIADDGNGNLQRYKYRVRQTADGQLEAIPGTIEVQDANTEEEIVETKIAETEDVASEIIVPEDAEYINDHPQYDTDDILLKSVQTLNEESSDVNDDGPTITQKFETTDAYYDDECGTPEYLLENSDEEDNEYSMSSNEEDLVLKLQKNYQLHELNYNNEEITRPHFLDTSMLPDNNIKIELQSTAVEKLEPVMKRKFFKSRNTNSSSLSMMNKHIADTKMVTVTKNDNYMSYVIIDSKEKENLSFTHSKKFGLKNARSILKSNYIITAGEENKNVNTKKIQTARMLTTKGTINKEKEIICPEENKTDEDKAPEVKIAAKSVRQPRKQTIKPIERLGSEIIVQPMYYTFNNDVPELIQKKRKYSHRISEVVKVSDDSDPDYTDKPKPRKKKSKLHRTNSKNKKDSEVMIVDSDITSDDDSVIEVLSDESEETDDINNDEKSEGNNIIDKDQANDEKAETENVEEETDLDKSDDILKIQEAVDDIVQEREKNEKIKNQERAKEAENDKLTPKPVDKTKKNNIKCPICPKTFPRQINLKTHMNIHSARRVLRSKTNSTHEREDKKDAKSAIIKKSIVKVSTMKKTPDTFNCPKCKQKFYSKIQLARHQTVHNDKKLVPKISPKKHQLSRNVNISPRKVRQSVPVKFTNQTSKITRMSNVLSKPTDIKKNIVPPKVVFKCEYCNKSFSQRILLNAHRVVHKQFNCSNCNTKFSTKTLLDEHLRKNCVKSPVSKPKLVRRSPVKSSVRTLLSCETCKQFFSTMTKLHEHETTVHKKQSNNKISPVKKIVTRPKKPHGGVPASTKMQRALDIMKLRS